MYTLFEIGFSFQIVNITKNKLQESKEKKRFPFTLLTNFINFLFLFLCSLPFFYFHLHR
jgi:hypothetical protein